MSARSKAAAVAACAVVVPATYVLVHLLHAPMLWLDPESMSWSFGERTSPLAMDFYGRGLASLVAGALAYLLARVASRKTSASEWMLAGAAACVVIALAGAVSFEAVRVSPKAPQLPVITIARR
ncbi:MAG: hypothetical protein ACJ790_16750 [Myxococcaceae bacterium]